MPLGGSVGIEDEPAVRELRRRAGALDRDHELSPEVAVRIGRTQLAA